MPRRTGFANNMREIMRKMNAHVDSFDEYRDNESCLIRRNADESKRVL